MHIPRLRVTSNLRKDRDEGVKLPKVMITKLCLYITNNEARTMQWVNYCVINVTSFFNISYTLSNNQNGGQN